jgi:hypothetical protein
MVTDPMPRSIAKRAEYNRSDKLATLALPSENRLHELALGVEFALSSELKTQVQIACNRLLAEASRFFNVPRPTVRVLNARPLRVYETGLGELLATTN